MDNREDLSIFDIDENDMVKLDWNSPLRNEYYISHVCLPMSYEDCLQRVEPVVASKDATSFEGDVQSEDDDQAEESNQKNYGKFAGALARIFEADHRIIGQVSNLDFLSRAKISKHKSKNYIQWVSMIEYDNNIEAVLTYIFCKRDRNGEEYDHSPKEKQRIDSYISKIIDNFQCSKQELHTDQATHIATEYIKWLAKRLWKDVEEYECYIPIITKAIHNRIYGRRMTGPIEALEKQPLSGRGCKGYRIGYNTKDEGGILEISIAGAIVTKDADGNFSARDENGQHLDSSTQ